LQVTNFLHWRKTTWALALWSGYIATWAVLTSSGPSMVILWWLAGLVIFRPLWFATQSAFGQGRTLDGFVRPGSTHWQVLGLHRTNPAEPRRDAG